MNKELITDIVNMIINTRFACPTCRTGVYLHSKKKLVFNCTKCGGTYSLCDIQRTTNET